MTCLEIERFVYPYLDGQFEPHDRLELEQHLASCSDCARRVHEEAQFHEGWRLKAREAVLVSAPATLRSSILAGVRRENRRAQQIVWLKASAAMIVVAASGSAYFHLRPWPGQRFVDDAVLWHAKGLPFEIHRESREQVEQWYVGKLDHRVPVPQLSNTRVAGARLSNVQDRPAAYISYETVSDGNPEPRRVGLFVFDDARGDLAAHPLPRIDVESSHGYNVAIWRDGEIVYELVSDLDEADIRKMLVSHPQLAGPAEKPAPSHEPRRRSDLDVQPASLRQ